MSQKKYNNYLYRIFKSFYAKDYYNYVAYEQKSIGINLLIFIIFITYLVPSLRIYQKFSKFSYATTEINEFKELADNLALFPEIYIKDKMLVNENNIALPYNMRVSFLDKNLVSITDQDKSLFNTDATILFGKEGVYFNNLEIISLLLKLFSIGEIPFDRLNDNVNFTQYGEGNININGDKLLSWSEEYINYMGSNVIFSLLPAALLAAILFKLIEIMILSLVTISLLNKRKLKFPYKKIFALTLVAMTPGLVLKALDAFSLWSSILVSNINFGAIFILVLNIYFIYFVVTSLQQNKREFE